MKNIAMEILQRMKIANIFGALGLKAIALLLDATQQFGSE